MGIWTSGRWSGSCVRSSNELQTKPREWPGGDGGGLHVCRHEIASITQFNAHTCSTRQTLVGCAWKIELLRLGDA